MGTEKKPARRGGRRQRRSDRAAGTPATVTEGQPVAFEVTLSGASDGSAAQIQVPYTVGSSGTYNVASGERSD